MADQPSRCANLMFDVTIRAGGSLEQTAEAIFDYLCVDSLDVAPQIETVDSYDYKWDDQPQLKMPADVERAVRTAIEAKRGWTKASASGPAPERHAAADLYATAERLMNQALRLWVDTEART